MKRAGSDVVAFAIAALSALGCAEPAREHCTGTGTGDADCEAADVPERGASLLPSSRPILTDYVRNARDLGGLPAFEGREVAYDALFRGPPLTPLAEDGCAAVSALGVRTLIDLRIDSERAGRPNAACVLDQVQEVLAPLPVPYSVSPSDYIADLNASESIAEVFRVLGDEAAYPVYFHCTWGRDRTGVLSALLLSALGVPRQLVLQEYLLSGNTVGAYPESLNAVLDTLEGAGGADAYLDAAGIPVEQRDMLRAKVLVESAPAASE